MLDINIILAVSLVILSLKLVSMLIVFILKLKYKYKAKVKNDEDLGLCFIKKVTTLNFRTEYDECYLLPAISISFNCGVEVSFHWLNLYYSSFWSVVTYDDENEYAEFIQYKNNKK